MFPVRIAYLTGDQKVGFDWEASSSHRRVLGDKGNLANVPDASPRPWFHANDFCMPLRPMTLDVACKFTHTLFANVSCMSVTLRTGSGLLGVLWLPQT